MWVQKNSGISKIFFRTPNRHLGRFCTELFNCSNQIMHVVINESLRFVSSEINFSRYNPGFISMNIGFFLFGLVVLCPVLCIHVCVWNIICSWKEMFDFLVHHSLLAEVAVFIN